MLQSFSGTPVAAARRVDPGVSASGPWATNPATPPAHPAAMSTIRNPHQIARGIAQRGLFMFSVGYGGCSVPGCNADPEPQPWSYTVGRVERGHPEFVVLGLEPAHSLRVAEWADARGRLLAEVPMRLDGHLVRADAVPAEWLECDPGRMGQWFAYYSTYSAAGHRRPAPSLVQLVWADHDDHFPDHPKCDRFVVECQPLLALDPIGYPALEPGRSAARARKRKGRAA